jgi:hypothetical protein
MTVFEWSDEWRCECIKKDGTVCGNPNACKIDGKKICVECFADENREEYDGGHIIYTGGVDEKNCKDIRGS